VVLTEITWNVSPEIFTIGSFSVRWYGLLFAMGFLVGQRIFSHIYRTEKEPESEIDSLMLYMVLSTVIGARVGHFVFYEWDALLAEPLHWFVEMVMPPYSGLASHGAFVGIITGLYLYCRKYKRDFLWVTDRVAIPTALAGFFIRLGNLMNHEIVGKPTDLPWAFKFMQNNEYMPIVPRHPSQLYESLSCLVLFFVLYFLWNKYRTATPRGLLVGLFLTWVFTLRFFYEFLKENQEAFENGMSFNMGQILSIVPVIMGIYFLIKAKKVDRV
jgi:phosphatidylglycerol---prolipoprotein diacylglyceryl transferase